MGLDVYVGSLTRYYARDWKTILEQLGEAQGFPVEVVRSAENDPPDAITDPNRILPIVLDWRDSLSAALESELQRPLRWNESHEAPYFTDKPTWDCYGGLLLWASYLHHADLQRPDGLTADWRADPAYARCKAEPCAFSQLLREGIELWFPVEFEFTFAGPDPSGRRLVMGSSVKLLEQLRALNEETFALGPAELLEQGSRCPADDAGLEASARYGLAVMLTLAERSVEHLLPMRLDY